MEKSLLYIKIEYFVWSFWNDITVCFRNLSAGWGFDDKQGFFGCCTCGEIGGMFELKARL